MSFDALCELFDKGKRPSKIIDYPVPKGVERFPVALVLLSDEDMAEASTMAEKWVHDTRAGLGASHLATALQPNLFDAEEERQILWRALRRADDVTQRLTLDVGKLRQVLTPDARLFLMRQYNDLCDQHSKILTEFEDMNKLRQTIVAFREAGGLSDYLATFDFGTLKNFVLSLAGQL